YPSNPPYDYGASGQPPYQGYPSNQQYDYGASGQTAYPGYPLNPYPDNNGAYGGYPPNYQNNPSVAGYNPQPYPTAGGYPSGGQASYVDAGGYIPSANFGTGHTFYQPTLPPFSPFNPNDDAQRLHNAMKGFGTVVFEEYRRLTGNDIIKAIKSEMSGDVESAFVCLAEMALNPPDYWARRLYEAMEGVGTGEGTLIRICALRSEIDMVQIKQAFQANLPSAPYPPQQGGYQQPPQPDFGGSLYPNLNAGGFNDPYSQPQPTGATGFGNPLFPSDGGYSHGGNMPPPPPYASTGNYGASYGSGYGQQQQSAQYVYQGTLTAFSPFNPGDDATKLYKAMKGIGTGILFN
ncbi:unnamed protein product, partial [Sphagnum tenellum]